MTLLPYIVIFAALFGAIGIYGKDRLNGFAFSALICAFWFLYGRHGYSGESMPSVFEWLAAQWDNPDYAYIWAMLFVPAYVIYDKRRELASVAKSPSVIGLCIVLSSLALHVIAFRIQIPSVSVITVVGAVWGTCYAVWGRRVARLLLFPMGYALLCLGNHLFVHIVPFLRLFMAAAAEWILNGAGIETVRQGSTLCSSAGHGFALDVADGCSGLRSLLTLTALAAPYAYYMMKGHWRKWALFLLSVPIAIFANLCRVIIMAALMKRMGMGLAMPLSHDAMGYFVVVVAVWALIKAGRIIGK